MRKKKVLAAILSFVLIMGMGVTSFAASVAPTEHNGNENPSAVTPAGAAYIKYDGGTAGTHTLRFDADGTANPSGAYYITFVIGTAPGNSYTEILSWSSNVYVYAVIVKGGPKYNMYTYGSPGSMGDTSLVSPVNASGYPANVSHVSFVFWKPTEEPQKGSLTVYKKDDSGNALSGAVFTLTPEGGGAAITGNVSGGTHTWSNLELGNYWLDETVVPSGYNKGANLPRLIAIGEGTNASITITNPRKVGSFTVYKKDDSGNALSGAVFTLTPVGGGAAITGNVSGGTHTWSNLTPGQYTLDETVVPAGYNKGANLPRTVTVNEGSNAAVTIENPRKVGDFKVYKVDESQSPLAGAVFTLTPVGGGSAITGVESPNGTHTWSNLPTGQYTLDETVVPAGYNKGANLPRTVTVDEGSNAAITIVNGRQVGGFTVYKVDGNRNPLAGAVFTLTPLGGGNSITGVESPNGTHTWSNLPTGKYTLDETTVPAGYSKGDNLPRTVTIGEGSSASVTIENPRNVGDFTVYKVDEGQSALAGAVFTLTPAGGGNAITGVESPSGTHTWSNLPTGDYTLDETVVPAGYNKGANLPRTVTVGEGSNAAITIVNGRDVGDFTVYKVDDDENALAGAVFTLTPVGGGSAITGIESPDGTHTWSNLPTGDYTLDETTVPAGFSKGANLPRTVTVNEGRNASITIKNPRKVGDFTVYKVDDDENALADAVFTLTPVGGGTAIAGVESPDGTHTWSNLPTGDYTLDETVVPSGYIKGDNLPRTVTVNEGSNAAVTIVNSKDHCSLKVYKKDSNGVLITGLSVTFTLEKADLSWSDTKSSDTGSVFWGDLEPGEYILTEVSAPDGYYYETQPDNVTLVNGDEKEVDVKNYKYVTIYALKRDIFTKAPLAGAEFAIFNTVDGLPTTQIGASQFTGSDGIAVFGKEYKLKANVMYWIKELNPPPGYKNDAATALGYPVIITEYGGNNEGNPVIFENTPLPGAIVIAKFEEGNTSVRLSGVKFSLYKDSVSTANFIATGTTDLNGNIVWSNLTPGKYVIVEDSTVSGYQIIDKTKNVTVVSNKTETVLLYNRRLETPTPTPPTNPPERTPTPTPTPTPTVTPTPVNTDELTIDEVDPAYGPETGEGDTLFITMGILLLLASALFVLRKRLVLKK